MPSFLLFLTPIQIPLFNLVHMFLNWMSIEEVLRGACVSMKMLVAPHTRGYSWFSVCAVY